MILISTQIGGMSQILKCVLTLLRVRRHLTSIRVPCSRQNHLAGTEVFLGELGSQQNLRVPKTLLRCLMFCS